MAISKKKNKKNISKRKARKQMEMHKAVSLGGIMVNAVLNEYESRLNKLKQQNDISRIN